MAQLAHPDKSRFYPGISGSWSRGAGPAPRLCRGRPLPLREGRGGAGNAFPTRTNRHAPPQLRQAGRLRRSGAAARRSPARQMDRRDLLRARPAGERRAQLPRLHRQLEGQAGQRAGDRHGPAIAVDLRARAAELLWRQDRHPRRHLRRPQRQGESSRPDHRAGRHAPIPPSSATPSAATTLPRSPISACLPTPSAARRAQNLRAHVGNMLSSRHLLPCRRPQGLRGADGARRARRRDGGRRALHPLRPLQRQAASPSAP